jgi:DNA-directed RNA polymerase subunit RPC12/RpoP
MKGKRVREEKKVRSLEHPSLPGIITCPRCGFDMELWTDEYETRCMNCGHRFFRRESTVH